MERFACLELQRKCSIIAIVQEVEGIEEVFLMERFACLELQRKSSSTPMIKELEGKT